jgi:hypothetical protein
LPSVLVLYQYFHPDDVVSAIHVSELAEGLSRRGWDVTANPCNRSCRTNKSYPRAGSYKGVKIKRTWRPLLPQQKSWGRAINCLWMLIAWSLQALLKRPDVVIIGTDPVLSAAVAIPWKILRPATQTVHWCFDLYPEAAVADGILQSGATLTGIKRIMTSAYNRIDLLADIGDCMRRRLSAYSSQAVQSRVWPWALAEPATVPDIDQTHRKAVFGSTKLAIMYSGNFGRAHSFSEVLTIARGMREVAAHFSFGIRGNRVAEAQQAVTAEDSNISFAPFAPADQLEARLSAADIHVVSLRPEWTGTVVPSKFFGALAAGRPVLFIGSQESCIAQLIRSFGLGWICPPGGEYRVAQQLRELAIDPSPLRELNARCHRIYNEHFARETVLDSFDRDLRDLLPVPCSTELIRD